MDGVGVCRSPNKTTNRVRSRVARERGEESRFPREAILARNSAFGKFGQLLGRCGVYLDEVGLAR